MHIGYVSIQQSTSIYKTVQGTFTTTGKREIAVSRSSFIEIFIFKKKNGRMISFSSVNFFSQIIFHTQFRFKNDIRDYLLVFEKNGNIIITKIDIYLIIKVHSPYIVNCNLFSTMQAKI